MTALRGNRRVSARCPCQSRSRTFVTADPTRASACSASRSAASTTVGAADEVSAGESAPGSSAPSSGVERDAGAAEGTRRS